MKTPEEIKKGLECCVCRYEDHMLKNCTSKCPYFHEGDFCKNVLHGDALAYIQQLEGKRNSAMLDYPYESGFLAGFKAAYPKWISVDERLPENDDDYLVFTSEAIEVELATYYGDGEWLTPDLDNLTRFVTHWMPLPEAPKEG